MSERDDAPVERLRRGDRRAFDAFFEQFAPPLLGYLTGMMGEREVAEDLVQETMVRVHRHIGRYEERGAFRAWVYQIATHAALSELRRRRHRRAAPLDDALDVADAAAGPHERLEAVERRAMLNAALGELPEEQRAVFLMRAQGLSTEEVAQVLRVPAGTVKSRLHHAVRQLRESVSGRDQVVRESGHGM